MCVDCVSLVMRVGHDDVSRGIWVRYSLWLEVVAEMLLSYVAPKTPLLFLFFIIYYFFLFLIKKLEDCTIPRSGLGRLL